MREGGEELVEGWPLISEWPGTGWWGGRGAHLCMVALCLRTSGGSLASSPNRVFPMVRFPVGGIGVWSAEKHIPPLLKLRLFLILNLKGIGVLEKRKKNTRCRLEGYCDLLNESISRTRRSCVHSRTTYCVCVSVLFFFPLPFAAALPLCIAVQKYSRKASTIVSSPVLSSWPVFVSTPMVV